MALRTIYSEPEKRPSLPSGNLINIRYLFVEAFFHPSHLKNCPSLRVLMGRRMFSRNSKFINGSGQQVRLNFGGFYGVLWCQLNIVLLSGSDNGMPRFYKPPNSRDFRHMTTMMGSAQRERNFPDPSTPPAQNNQPQPIRRVEPFPRNDQHQQQQQIPAHHRSVINPFVPTRQNAGSSGYRPVGVNAVDLSSHAQNPRMIAPQSVIRIPLPGSAGGSIMSSNPFAAAFTNGNVERNEPVEAGIKVEKGASQSENGQISFPVIRQHYAQRREGFNGEHEYGAGRIIRPPVFHHTLAEVAPPLSIREWGVLCMLARFACRHCVGCRSRSFADVSWRLQGNYHDILF